MLLWRTTLKVSKESPNFSLKVTPSTLLSIPEAQFYWKLFKYLWISELFLNLTRVTKIIRYYTTVFGVVSIDTIDCKGKYIKEGKDSFLTLNFRKALL